MSDARHRTGSTGFTLLELLVASAILAVLAGALFSVFSSALKLRERAYETIERELPESAALEIFRRDLQGAVLPAGTIFGPFLGSSASQVSQGSQSNGMLEFYTTSGALSDLEQAPWGEVQKVTYTLLDAPTSTAVPGKELVREVTRNLLAPIETEAEYQRLLDGVQSLSFGFYSEQAWLDAWDSTANEDTAPEAIRMRIDFVQADDADRPRPPLELVCPVAVQASSSQKEEATAEE